MSDFASYLTTALSAGLPAGILWQWYRHRPAPKTPVRDQVASAPAHLRPAVFIVTDSDQLALMWTAVKLGSWETGFPNVQSADYTAYGMSVLIQIRGGQKLADWTNEHTRDALSQYLGVPEIQVTADYPGFIRLHLITNDVLAEPVSSQQPLNFGVDLEAVPVGVTEQDDMWRLRVLYGHILLAGAMGSGKGSVLWSLIAGLGPAIKAGLVDVWMADPKGGAEFGKGENTLFVRFATDAGSILGMLREAEKLLQERLIQMRRAGLRKHVPTVDEPLILIIIDEAASLSSYATREEQEEFRRSTGMLLSQGRAAAVSVVAALQDPSKETMPNRQLFPIRIGLRLDEPTQTTMVHGQGARDRGALCDKISELTPGVGYVGQDGTTEFTRVRSYWVSDQDIDRIVDTYSPDQPDFSPQGDYSGFDPTDFGDIDEQDQQQGPAAA